MASKYNYGQDGALIITHFAPDAVTAACGVYILHGTAAWTEEPELVEGCLPCLRAVAQEDNGPPFCETDNGPPFCHCPGEGGGCPCYNLGYARGKEQAAQELAFRPGN